MTALGALVYAVFLRGKARSVGTTDEDQG
jgi:hypothetical protein